MSRSCPSVALRGISRLESSEWQQWFAVCVALGLTLIGKDGVGFKAYAKQAGPKWLKIRLGYF